MHPLARHVIIIDERIAGHYLHPETFGPFSHGLGNAGQSRSAPKQNSGCADAARPP